jgi:hypothetical protein
LWISGFREYIYLLSFHSSRYLHTITLHFSINTHPNNHQLFIMDANNNNTNQTAGKEDYLDKGLDAAEKKYGGSMGQDSQKNRAMNEKIVCSIDQLDGPLFTD